jgi:hypothetical protein
LPELVEGGRESRERLRRRLPPSTRDAVRSSATDFGGAGFFGGDVDERMPMLARMSSADVDAVMSDHLLVDLGQARVAFHQVGIVFRARRSRGSAELSRNQGRPCAARAGSITKIGAVLCERLVRVKEAVDVAVDDDGNRNRVFSRRERAPIRVALVELATRAAVNGDEPARRRLAHAAQLGRV